MANLIATTLACCFARHTRSDSLKTPTFNINMVPYLGEDRINYIWFLIPNRIQRGQYQLFLTITFDIGNHYLKKKKCFQQPNCQSHNYTGDIIFVQANITLRTVANYETQ